MSFFKNHILQISLTFLMLILVALCTYKISSYSNNALNGISQNAPTNFKSAKPNNARPNRSQSKPSMPQSNQSPAPQPNAQNIQPSGRGMNRMGTESSNSNSKYSPAFIAYCILFFVLFIIAYLILVYKKIKINNSKACILIIAILIVGFLLRIYSGLLIDGHPFDINIYKRWATSAANSLLTVYGNNSSIDYPPVYIYILSIVGKLSNMSVFSKYYFLLLKLPSIIADILSAYFIYRIANKRISRELSILLSAFYIFNPAVLINSTIWGQADSLFTFIVILAVYFLSEERLVFSSIFFTLTVLMKPQGIILLPLVLFELIKKRNLESLIKCILPALITSLIIILPFSISNHNITWIFSLYKNTISEYPYASDNAFNFFSLIGANHIKDTTTMFILSYHNWGMIFIVLITILSGFIYIKSTNKSAIYIAALIQIVGVFNFSVGMHERYMFTATAMCILAYIYIKNRHLLVLTALFSLIIYINTHTTLFEQFNGVNIMPYNVVMIFTSLLNVLSFIYLIIISIQIIFRQNLIK